MRAGGSNLQAPFFGSSHQFAACAPHVRRQFVHVVANLRADFNDGLMHLGLHLLAQARRSGGNKLAYVRTQLSRRRVNNLKLFFDTYSEPVIHERSSPVRNTGSSLPIIRELWPNYMARASLEGLLAFGFRFNIA